MSTIVLVHGGGHGAWCWEPVMSRLETPSLAVDLPGRGRRPLPLEDATAEIWAESLRDAIVLNDLRDVLLVGHSMGGLSILRVATMIPERLKRLVFLASPIPGDGLSLADLYGPHDPERLRNGVPPELALEMFGQDLTPEQAAWALKQIQPESIKAFEAPYDLSAVKGPVPRTYIRTGRDKACPPMFQDQSIEHLQPVDVVHMNAGHSVMIADPEAVATILDRLARQAG